jgi:hypothetical protein
LTAARGASDPLARVIFGLLVVGSIAAFGVTQRLKHTPTAVQRFELTPYFSPTPAGHLKQEQLSFRIAHPDEVTVTIVNLGGEQVATLASEQPLGAYTQLSLRWNGRRGFEGSGRAAPEGEYRVQVSLKTQRVVKLSPNSFTLVRHPRSRASSGGGRGSSG